MQPYFFPYAGYFGLLANVDVFVIFDCVQFRQRGRIHRTEVPGRYGRQQWLTLPIRHCPRDTLIRDIQFTGNARAALDDRLTALEWFDGSHGEGAQMMRDHLGGTLGQFGDFLETSLRLAAQLLHLDVRILRSSSLNIQPQLVGQDRVLAILERMDGTRYVNLSGGRILYEPRRFAQAGFQLDFMPEYKGPYVHMMYALMNENLADVRKDVVSQVAKPAL